MRIGILVVIVAIVSGCVSTYEQQHLVQPSSKLVNGRSVIISTPVDGSYGSKQYPASGKMTALALNAAFSKNSSSVVVSSACRDLACLKENNPEEFDYYVVPEILHWEDRNTEWSGKPDRIQVQLSIYEGKTWKQLASTTISGKSKWATFGGDHPQDLLQDPFNSYIESLY